MKLYARVLEDLHAYREALAGGEQTVAASDLFAEVLNEIAEANDDELGPIIDRASFQAASNSGLRWRARWSAIPI